eukprot:75592-Hanusia_phi.AAC.2
MTWQGLGQQDRAAAGHCWGQDNRMGSSVGSSGIQEQGTQGSLRMNGGRDSARDSRGEKRAERGLDTSRRLKLMPRLLMEVFWCDRHPNQWRFFHAPPVCKRLLRGEDRHGKCQSDRSLPRLAEPPTYVSCPVSRKPCVRDGGLKGAILDLKLRECKSCLADAAGGEHGVLSSQTQGSRIDLDCQLQNAKSLLVGAPVFVSCDGSKRLQGRQGSQTSRSEPGARTAQGQDGGGDRTELRGQGGLRRASEDELPGGDVS